MSCDDDGDPRYPDLTMRQRKIYAFIADFHERNGYAPSHQEIAAAAGLKTVSSVAYQLRLLQEGGYLDREPGRPRTVKPRRQARGRAAPTSSAASEYSQVESRQVMVQVIGRVAAGEMTTAADLAEEYVNLPADVAGSYEHFALEVAGDSMIGKAICDGDRVVVRWGAEARNGDTVVAQLDDTDTSPEGEATLKTFKRVGDHVWLMPENPAYEPILGDKARILGRVVYLIRMFR